MCNHYRNHPQALQTWREYIGADLPDDEFSDIKIDVWPTRASASTLDDVRYPGTVVRWEGKHQVLDQMAWGIITTVAGKTKPLKKAVTNVRNLASPFWKSVLASPAQRCLVPFSEFAEPVIGKGREEHWFSVTDRPSACFAGIWRLSEGLPRYAFLTCEPNPLVAPLHPKAMPVILAEEDHERWMNCDYEEAVSLASPYPSQMMRLIS